MASVNQKIQNELANIQLEISNLENALLAIPESSSDLTNNQNPSVVSDYEQQATETLNTMNVKFTAKYAGYKNHFSEGVFRHTFKCTFSRNGKRFSVTFGQSISAGNTPPTAYDLLACITKYDPYSFDNFCADYGFDANDRNTKKTYKAVLKEWGKVSAFFTESELEILREIQ